MKATFHSVVIPIVLFLSTHFSNALPIDAGTVPSPLAALKQKLTALNLLPSNMDTNLTTYQHPLKMDFPEASFLTDFVKTLVAHIKAKIDNETKTQILTTTSAPSTTTLVPSTTENIFSPENVTNNYEDALLREVYLDWGNKRQSRQIENVAVESLGEEAAKQLQLPAVDIGQEEYLLSLLQQQQPDITPISQDSMSFQPDYVNPTNAIDLPVAYVSPLAVGAADSIAQESFSVPAQLAASPNVFENNFLPYSSPPVTSAPVAPSPLQYPLGMFDPMTAYKMQKALAKAQMKAYVESLKPTTTPKPTKIKLKFSLAAGATLPPALQGYVDM